MRQSISPPCYNQSVYPWDLRSNESDTLFPVAETQQLVKEKQKSSSTVVRSLGIGTKYKVYYTMYGINPSEIKYIPPTFPFQLPPKTNIFPLSLDPPKHQFCLKFILPHPTFLFIHILSSPLPPNTAPI
jgi:hypothetical protein